MIVLDTHVWLRWIQKDHTLLKSHWVEQIADSERVGVSAISCFEVAWLAQHARIQLPEPLDSWFEKALAGSSIDLIALTPQIAHIAVQLPEHHRDPQDPLIIAIALAHDAMLISADEKFPLYNELQGRLL
ncbi:type II toxin-antitoxin system VapC family toxin [Methylolobus aquaticus]